MADYNTFSLIDTKSKKIILTTSSARKCKRAFEKGYRIDVWNKNTLIEKIYNKNLADINKYVRLEKEHIARKQEQATLRNKRRKERLKNRAVRNEYTNRQTAISVY